MNRSKIILAVAAVLFLAAVVALGTFALGLHGKAAEARKSRDGEFRSLEKFYQEEVFPSKENVETLRGNVARYGEIRAAFASELAARNVPAPTNVSASVFMQKLQDLVDQKRKKAPVVEGKKSVAPTFSFGFERYFGAAARMPREAEVPRLVQQLVIVSTVVDELYAANVLQILAIRRPAFESADESVSVENEDAPRSRRRGGRRNGEGEGASAQGGSSYVVETPLYRAQRFTINFAARQHAAVDVLNRLARLRYFVIVSDVRIHKVAPDVRVPEEHREEQETHSTGRRGAQQSAAESAEADAQPVLSDLPPAQRMLSGPDIDPPLDVTVTFDVYDFTGEAE